MGGVNIARDFTFIAKSDPAAQWTGAHKGHAFFAYSDNYLIDLKASIIMDVEPTRAIRQAEVGATKTMIERTEERFGLKPKRLSGDSTYGTTEILNWIVTEKIIAPHVALFGKSERSDGTFSLSDFRFDTDGNSYTCPAGSWRGGIVEDDKHEVAEGGFLREIVGACLLHQVTWPVSRS